jgi:hypothetical protein
MELLAVAGVLKMRRPEDVLSLAEQARQVYLVKPSEMLISPVIR